MHNLDHLIADLALILVSAGITTLIFKKIKQPLVLGYIVVGFLTGSNFQWFPTVVDLESISIWAEIGIIFLMFALGLEFSFQKLTNLGGSVIVTALTVITAMVLIGYTVGQLMGWNRMDSIFLGGMISISSTMIILKAYEEFELKKEKFANLVFGVLIFEDLASIFMMIVLSTLAVSRGVSGVDMAMDISILLLYLVLWLVLGIYLIPSGLKKVRGLINDETLLIACIGFCLVMVVIANEIGFSSALGAFLAGSILAGTVMAEKIEEMIKPIKDLFGAIFFVSVGMMVVPSMVTEYLIPILIISVTVVLGQMFFSGIGALLSGQSLHTAVRTGFSFVQIGEFSFIIATLGMSLGVTSDFLYPIVVCVCVVTTFITPMMIRSAEWYYSILCTLLPDRTVDFLNRYTSEKRSDNDKDEDWRNYLKRFFVRTVVCTAALFTIYVTASKFLTPLIYRYLIEESRILELILLLALMSPFISIMCSGRRRIPFVKLWLKNPTNRLPLVALNGLRIGIAIFFIILTTRKIYPIVPLWILIPLALVIIFVIEKSDLLKSKSLTLETKFITNYNERLLEKAKKERGITGNHNWVDEKLYVAKFKVRIQPKKDAVREFYAKRLFGIYIIRIIRENVRLNLPHATDKIMAGDIIYVMGTKQQIEPYLMMLKKLEHIEVSDESPVMLRDFIYSQTFEEIEPEEQLICCAIEIPKKSPLTKRAIKDSGFRATYKGYIIGIERGIMPIISIDKNTALYEGDLLWAIGMQEMVDKLLVAGLIK